MSKRTRKQKDLTRLAHAGRDPSLQYGFVNMPVYRGSTVIFPTLASLEADDQEFSYGRLGTPTVRALEEAIAAESPSPQHLVEDLNTQQIARANLAAWKKAS